MVKSDNTTCPSVDCPAMARPLRIEFPHAIHYVTSRGHALQDIVQGVSIACCAGLRLVSSPAILPARGASLLF